MQWQQIPLYAVILLGAAVISLIIGMVAWRRRTVPGATSLMLLAAAAAIWSGGYAVELATTRIFWAKVQYLGIVLVAVGWLTFSIQYMGREQWLNRRTLPLLWFWPLFFLTLVWTNEYHQLIWTSIDTVSKDSYEILDFEHGPGFWACITFSYICLMLGSIFLVRAFLRSLRFYRRQILVLLAVLLPPWIGNAMYITGLNPWPHLDMTPFGFAVSCVGVAFGLMRLHLLDVVPVARDLALESMTDGVLILDEQSRIVDLNATALQGIGRPASEIIGQSSQEIFARWEDVLQPYYGVPELAKELAFEQDGEQRYVDLRISPVYDRRKRLKGRIVVWRDITDRKRMEEALRQRNEELVVLHGKLSLAKEAAEASSRTKSIFLANMSHELRTPLSAILGYSSLLQMEATQIEAHELVPDLVSIEKAGSHLLELINSILDLSKIEAGKMELDLQTFDVVELVAEVRSTIRSLITQNSNTLQVQYGDDIGIMYADQIKTRQILLNLLSNAAKFTQHGEVKLTVCRERRETEEWIVFRISDTGIGIPQDKIVELFQDFMQVDPSSTRKYGGTGLGLAISQRFSHLMGGFITVTSAVGEGSTFTVYLPDVVDPAFAEAADLLSSVPHSIDNITT